MALNKDGQRRPRPPEKTVPSEIRLNKYLADCGLASRRKADEMISSGQVQVNGKTVYELGIRIEPGIDRVIVDGLTVKPPTQKIYVIFNKPDNVLTTM